MLENNLKYAIQMRVLANGGTFQIKNGKLHFAECHSVEICLDAATN